MVNNEIELMRTTDAQIKKKVVSLLVRSGISYLEKDEKIPFFKRKEYGGEKEICVIMINGNQKEKAVELLESMGFSKKEE